MVFIRDITRYLEQLAPPAYQESYDNAGLIAGDPAQPVERVLLSLDATEAVVAEAIEKGCQLVISHHPIVFRGLKRFTGQNYVERALIRAIRGGIGLFAAHTNLDAVQGGVNFKLAEKIGLEQVRVLAPKKQVLSKLTTFVPPTHTQQVLEVLYQAGGGQIGNYDQCSFRVSGTGTFRPNAQANPFLGTAHVREEAAEERIELIFPSHLSTAILQALRQAHPYEEVAYYLTLLENENQEVGSGAIGLLPRPLPVRDFLEGLKLKLNLACIRYTALVKTEVQKIALCGGSGSFLLPQALRQKADVFVSADFKYHEFFDAEDQLVIADIGHFESEAFTIEIFSRFLSEKFPNIAVIFSQTPTNPVNYL
jgi:dinuclear metal center YbgI/SA1388 family protein